MSFKDKILAKYPNAIFSSANARRSCNVEGCTQLGQHTGRKRVDGSIIYRNKCTKHHGESIAAKHGLPSLNHVVAMNAGFSDPTEYKNSIHPYLKYRKTYCENIDSRLGERCTSNIFWKGMLDVDHIDGNSSNNNPENLQTLCKCCHAYKTNISEDWKTPGRKAIKESLRCEAV